MVILLPPDGNMGGFATGLGEARAQNKQRVPNAMLSGTQHLVCRLSSRGARVGGDAPASATTDRRRLVPLAMRDDRSSDFSASDPAATDCETSRAHVICVNKIRYDHRRFHIETETGISCFCHAVP
jgi:hypothetical protein